MKLLTITFAALLLLTACSKTEKVESPAPVTATHQVVTPPSVVQAPPAPPLAELNKAYVVDAIKRASLDNLPSFLTVSDADYSITNSVDAIRMIRGEAVFTFIENTYRPVRTVSFQTSATRYLLTVLHPVKQKNETIHVPLTATLDLSDFKPLINVSVQEDLGKLRNSFGLSAIDGDEIDVQAEKLVTESFEADKRAGRIKERWEALQRIQRALSDFDYFAANSHHPIIEIDVLNGLDDVSLRQAVNKQVLGGKISKQERHANYVRIVQQRFDETYPRFAAIIEDATKKRRACEDFFLKL